MKNGHDDNETAIKAYYAKWWGNPQDIRDQIFKRLYHYLEKQLPDGRGKKALDVGTGKGAITSILVKKGYQVTAVDLNETFLKELKDKFPDVQVLHGKIESIELPDHYDVTTMIELIPNLPPDIIPRVMQKISRHTNHLFTDISNRNSFHGMWVEFRKFRNSFVYPYTPRQMQAWLEMAGFNQTHQKGIGLLTPVSLRRNFRGQFIPGPVVRVANCFEDFFPRHCHIYYTEAKVNPHDAS